MLSIGRYLHNSNYSKSSQLVLSARPTLLSQARITSDSVSPYFIRTILFEIPRFPANYQVLSHSLDNEGVYLPIVVLLGALL